MSGRLVSAGFRFLGPPPAAGAPRHERLRWIRGYYIRILPLALLTCVLVAVFLSPPWDWVAPLVGALLWLQGFGSLTLRIRRDQHDSTK
jgi:hypothetical protein